MVTRDALSTNAGFASRSAAPRTPARTPHTSVLGALQGLLRAVLRPCAALWLVALCLVAAPARSEAPNAEQAFEQGRELWEKGDCQAALPLLRQAVDATGSPNARLYVGLCLKELGRLPEAYDEMAVTVGDARKRAGQEERYAQTRDAAAAELAVLEGKVGRVVVVVDSALRRSKIELNGASLAADRIGIPIAVHPGSIVVAALRADGTRIEQKATIAAGTIGTVTLSAPASEPVAAPAPTAPKVEPVEPEDEPGGFGVVRAVGIGVAALGVAGFVTFGIENAKADDRMATLEEACGAGPCTDPSLDSVIEEGQTAETIANVGLAVGIAGVLAATAMIIFGGDDGDDARDAAVAVGPGGATFRLRF